MKSVIFLLHFNYSFGILYLICFRHHVTAEECNANVAKNDPCLLKIKSIKVPLDHSHEYSNETWNMRYMQNTVFWNKNSSIILLYIGGNEPLKKKYILDSVIFDLAREYEAALYATEHRFYGSSNLTSNEITYLTSLNALADVKELVKYLKEKPEYKNTKVVAVGTGYGGTLAVWMKLTYPKDIDAVIASSAPLLVKVEFEEYLDHVTKTYHNHTSEKCTKLVCEVVTLFNKYIKEKKFTELKKLAHVCDDVNLKNETNQQVLFLSLYSGFMLSAEQGIQQMQNTCSLFEAKYANATDGKLKEVRPKLSPFSEGEHFFWRDEEKCLDVEMKTFIKKLKKEENKDIKHWWYQCCTHFGFFPTTKLMAPPYNDNIPLDFYYKICSSLFGSEFKVDNLYEMQLYTNKKYGGLKPPLNNVIYVNGDLDPWITLGVTDASDKNKTIVSIPNVSHSKDLAPKSPDDSKPLLEAREFLISYLKNFLN